MPAPFVVAFVPGVTPGKWAGVWQQRRPWHRLDLRPLSQHDALAALSAGEVDAAFLRLPVDTELHHAIPLYTEQPVVVAEREHPAAAFDSLTLADLDGETVLEGEWADTIALVAANAGVAIVPQSVARAFSRKDLITRPITDAPTTEVALVWPRSVESQSIQEWIGVVRGRTSNSSRGR
jgi:DNA-binding transcriptional LysR family regulator